MARVLSFIALFLFACARFPVTVPAAEAEGAGVGSAEPEAQPAE